MSVTIETLESMCARQADLRAEEARLSQLKKEVSQQLEIEEQQFIEVLKSENKTYYKSRVGAFTITHKSSIKTPKTPEEKAAFFEYLKSKGLYDRMISVNSVTLNSWYKEELDNAIREGNSDFSIPGLSEPTIIENVSFRRG